MTIGDQKFNIILDTGCLRNGMLSQDIAASLVKSKHATTCLPPRPEKESAGPSRSEAAIRCHHIEVAGPSNEDLIFPTGRHNILGLWYLSRYRCAIDLAKNTLMLEQTPDSDIHEHFDNDGLWFRMSEDHRIVIKDVAPGSLADLAGFKRGDFLVTFDERPIGNRKLPWVHMDFFYKRRAKASIMVLRDDQEVQLELAAAPVTKLK